MGTVSTGRPTAEASAAASAGDGRLGAQERLQGHPGDTAPSSAALDSERQEPTAWHAA